MLKEKFRECFIPCSGSLFQTIKSFIKLALSSIAHIGLRNSQTIQPRLTLLGTGNAMRLEDTTGFVFFPIIPNAVKDEIASVDNDIARSMGIRNGEDILALKFVLKTMEQHGIMILESVENGPLIWPTIEENGVTRPKKYFELSATEAIQADCDIKATNIIL
ncbi:hypothetical protein Tco_0255735 [Tanacetum coccineum]